MKRVLYHFPLSPFSRKIRLILAEKKLDFELVEEKYWERRREFIAMNPASQVPVLFENDKYIADSIAVSEYLDEEYTKIRLIGDSIEKRYEVRRIANWFNNKFYYEVSKYIVDERVIKFLNNSGEPNSNALRAAKSNIKYHLDYIEFLVSNRKWLAGEEFSLADITAAAHLSVLDFLGEVPWEYNENAKHWYSLIKSRPSFRPLLSDKVLGFKPPPYYKNLDF